MAQLAGERSCQVKEEKLPLANDRFDIAPEQVKEEHVPEQMPRTVVQERRRNELPAIRRTQAVVAQRQIFSDESGLIRVQEKLGDENREVRAN